VGEVHAEGEVQPPELQQQRQEGRPLKVTSSKAPISSEVSPLSTQNEVTFEGLGGVSKGSPSEQEAVYEWPKHEQPTLAANQQRSRANLSGPALPEHISFICTYSAFI